MKKLISKVRNFLINFRMRYYKNTCLKMFKGKTGLEIGGPSSIFHNHGFLPIYSIVKNLDGCNFSCETVWEGKIKEGSKNYCYLDDSLPGYQYVCEATELKSIKSNEYDFILCSHILEHSANPLRAIEEFLRVLKEDGVMLIVLPDSRYTFDHNRQVTPFSHLIADYKNKMEENDLTHLDEILRLHDLSMDAPAGTLEQFQERSLLNYKNRCLHQHVFNLNTMKKLSKYFNLKILFLGETTPFHMIMLVRKPLTRIR